MKQVKVKKIKKIPKYSEGGLAELSDKSGLAPGKIIQPDVVTKKIGQDASNVFNKNFGGGVGTQSMPSFSGISALNTGMGVAAAASQPIASALGIEQGKAGQLVGGVGKAVGLINPVAGLAIETVAPFLGGTGHVNYDQITTTSNAKKAVQERSGILGGLFGKDSDQLYVNANQYQNSLVAAELTANKQLEWANDPRNQYTVDTLKDGGKVGMTPVYLDSEEVVTDENGNNAVRMPYAEGTDSILALAKPKSRVFSKYRGYADIAEKIIKGTEEGSRLRQIETNKLAMIQEITNVNKPGKSNVLHAKDGKIIPYVQLGLSALQALGKEKSETTRLQRPVWKAAPVGVDVLNQLQDAQLGYALANYNTAQGGYTVGQQLAARGAAASNFARQRAQIHQWQTEQQNKNIARNIAAFNTHSNVLAEIGNKEIDINDANRAAVRNINRENWKALSKNIGMYGRDVEGWNSNAAQIAALEGLGEYAYVNWNDIVKSLNKLTKNGSKQIR